MEFVATTFKNLEPLLAEELESLGAHIVNSPKRAVVCEGEEEVFYRCLYRSRFALRMLVPILKFKIFKDQDLYHEAKAFNWSKYLNAYQEFAIQASVHSHHFNHTKYPVYLLKDAICDFFQEKSGARPNVNVDTPDVQFHLRASENFITVSLDASGFPLYKRGYKSQSVNAPLNEILAAAIIAHTDTGEKCFLDAMTGSGTIICEALMARQKIPAQYFRKEFGLFNWNSFDKNLWKKILNERNPSDGAGGGNLFAWDFDHRALKAADINLTNMKGDTFVQSDLIDFFESEAPCAEGIIVMNPPYDERMSLDDASSFYRAIGDHLKKAYKGWSAWVFTGNFDALRKIGMKPSKKIILYNGPLECRLHRYDIYA